MKKLIALLLVGLLIFTAVGCSKDEESPATSDDPAVSGDTPGETQPTGDAVDPQEQYSPPIPVLTTQAEGNEDYDYIMEKGTLVIGITDFQPLNYKDDSGEWVGYDTQLAKLFGEALGIEIEFVEIDMSNKVLELESKTIDCVWNGMALSAENESALELTNTYLYNAQVLVVPKDSIAQFQSSDKLAGLSVAVEAGSSAESAVNALGYTAFPVATKSEALIEVTSGASDACVIDSSMARSVTGEGNAYEDLAFTVSILNEEYSVGFRKDSAMADVLDEFFKITYANGSMTHWAEQYGTIHDIIPQ